MASANQKPESVDNTTWHNLLSENGPHGQSVYAFLEAMPNGFAALSSDGRFTYVNCEAEQLWMTRRVDLVGRTPEEVFGSGRLQLELRGSLDIPVVREFELFDPSSDRWFSYKINPAPLGGLSVYFEEITKRKGMEIAAARLSAIVDSTEDAIVSKDLNGVILTWNKSAERLFGYTADETIGQSIMMVIPSDRANEETEIIARLNRGERVEHFETQRRRKDGSLVDLSLTISPIRDSSGKIVGASKIARDITERKRIYDELTQANKDLEQFAFSASHDLQEPLRTIKIYSELLATRLADAVTGEPAQFLGHLREAATRMEALVRDLLAYTQVTMVDKPVELEDPRAAIEETLSLLSASLAESGGHVTFDSLPAVPVHGIHLRLLFQNLIGNAIKYRSPERPLLVHVSAAQRVGSWVFTVRDNGIGIKPEYKEQIFGLFTRLHTGEEYAGTGIGLAICQRIMERYHGRVWVESKPGEGAEFNCDFPV